MQIHEEKKSYTEPYKNMADRNLYWAKHFTDGTYNFAFWAEMHLI